MLDSLGKENLYFKTYVALAHLKAGNVGRANELADQQIQFSQERITRKLSGYEEQYFLMAQAYAIKDDAENTLSSLRLFNQLDRMDIKVVTMREDPIFERLRDDPEFKRILGELEAKYQAEHDRVGQWLEANDIQQE